MMSSEPVNFMWSAVARLARCQKPTIQRGLDRSALNPELLSIGFSGNKEKKTVKSTVRREATRHVSLA